MDQTVAREIARLEHSGHSTRFGESVFVHVQRVADGVAPESRNAALLQELTHRPDDPYFTHVRRIAESPGDLGRIARLVKLADLDDHLSHPVTPPDAPPYAWARRCLLEHGAFDV